MIQNLPAQYDQLSRLDRLFRTALLRRCQRLQGGAMEFIDADGPHCVGAVAAHRPLRIVVHNPRLYSRIATGGTLGAAESWMAGEWDCNELVPLVRLLIRNLALADRWQRHSSVLRRIYDRLQHWWRSNSRRKAKQNIRAHYDLGNEFFSLFLDPSMNYSSAMFISDEARQSSDPRRALAAAQQDKMEAICRRLQLEPGQSLLEIGSGWGALACHAAAQHGCQVVTTTISPAQFKGACARVTAEGLEDQVRVWDRDYRDLEGSFDKLVSVEMIEAVGDAYYPAFFQACRRHLKPGGLALIQAITIIDSRYRQHLHNVDFISKYIFPGGSLPCLSRLIQAASAAGLRLVTYSEFSEDYARTLEIWRGLFAQQAAEVRRLGHNESFIRMWDYYLAYCQAGFLERQINVGHLVFTNDAR